MSRIIQYGKKYAKFIKQSFGNDASAITYVKNAFLFAFSYIKYGTSISDYFELGYYNRNSPKSEYATLRINKPLAYSADNKEIVSKYCDKNEMYRGIYPFLGRKILFTRDASYEDFEAFVDNLKAFLYKPNYESCGRGIQKILVTGKSLHSVWEEIQLLPEGILDELIVQHHKLSDLCPQSVNTVRIFTCKVADKIYFIGGCLRVGKGQAFVDNYSSGGLVISLDLKTGIAVDDAEDMYRNRYSEHPLTHIKLEGFQVPHWDKVIDLVKEASIHYELNYVAWDIAIRENDCVLVECNAYGQIAVIQIAGGKPKRKICEMITADAKTISDKYKKYDEYSVIFCE